MRQTKSCFRGVFPGLDLAWRSRAAIAAPLSQMYQLDASSTLRLPRPETLQRVWTVVGRTVLALGCTSLLTDVSSEMVSTVLPIYLVLHLGLTPLQFGLVDGIYQGITALVRLLGGLAADRSQR